MRLYYIVWMIELTFFFFTFDFLETFDCNYKTFWRFFTIFFNPWKPLSSLKSSSANFLYFLASGSCFDLFTTVFFILALLLILVINYSFLYLVFSYCFATFFVTVLLILATILLELFFYIVKLPLQYLALAFFFSFKTLFRYRFSKNEHSPNIFSMSPVRFHVLFGMFLIVKPLTHRAYRSLSELTLTVSSLLEIHQMEFTKEWSIF